MSSLVIFTAPKIKAYSTDAAATYICSNTSSGLNLTYNTLYAMTINKYLMTLTGNPGETIAATTNPLIINNTGNANYTKVGITPYDLVKGGDILAVGNFSMDSSGGTKRNFTTEGTQTMVPNSDATSNETLPFGATQKISLNLQLRIPSGIPQGNYTATAGDQWIVDAIA